MGEFKTFEGGLHPPGLKTTQESPIEELAPPSKVILPLVMHIGAPAKPLVKVGDFVTRGQKIAEPGGFVSAAIFATISGKVQAIGNFLHPMGFNAPSVVIEAQAKPADGSTLIEEPRYQQEVDPFSLSEDEIKKRISDAGIVGLGGATFPTHVKLSPPATKPIDTVILNGVECEPALTSDHRLMLEDPDKIIIGLKLLMKVLKAKKGIIGIEGNKLDAINLFEKKLFGETNLSVQGLEVKYPQGGEKQLIVAILGREVPSGGLPMDVGVVVQNVGTSAAIFDAVCMKKPLMDRVVTLAGNCAQKPGNYRVRIGMTVNDFIQIAGGLKKGVTLKKVIIGGPMMGYSLFDLFVPVIKGTSGILLWDESEAIETQPGPCIRCGRCIEACSLRLVPQKIATLVEKSRWKDAEELGILDCLECGCCAYTCPAKRYVVQTLRWGKKIVTDIKKREAELAKSQQRSQKP